MSQHVKLAPGNELLGSGVVDLGDGRKVVTEVVAAGDVSTVISVTIEGGKGAAARTMCHGYCDGVYIGSVDCPNNDPFLDCINKTISCQS